MLRLISTLAMLCALPTVTGGSSCRTASYATVATTYSYPVYQAQVFAVPLYSLGHYQQGTSLESLSVLEELKLLRQDHNKLLQVLASQGNGNRGLANLPPHILIAQKECSQCHTQGQLRGTKFAMFTPDGQFLLEDQQGLEYCVERVAKGEMPPNRKLSQTDSAQFVISVFQTLSQQAQAKAQPNGNGQKEIPQPKQ